MKKNPKVYLNLPEVNELLLMHRIKQLCCCVTAENLLQLLKKVDY